MFVIQEIFSTAVFLIVNFQGYLWLLDNLDDPHVYSCHAYNALKRHYAQTAY